MLTPSQSLPRFVLINKLIIYLLIVELFIFLNNCYYKCFSIVSPLALSRSYYYYSYIPVYRVLSLCPTLLNESHPFRGSNNIFTYIYTFCVPRECQPISRTRTIFYYKHTFYAITCFCG